ncbi:MAG: hypothetical protein AABX51_06350 [Nanoarchaeota archaeon]
MVCEDGGVGKRTEEMWSTESGVGNRRVNPGVGAGFPSALISRTEEQKGESGTESDAETEEQCEDRRVNRAQKEGVSSKMFELDKTLPDILIIIGIMIAIRISIIFRRKKMQPYSKKIEGMEEQLEKARETLDEIWPNRPGMRRKKLKERKSEVIGQ